MKDIFDNPFPTTEIFKNENQFEKYASIVSDLLFSDSTIQKPEITIVIPTYKGRLVFEAIQSAIEQVDAPDYDIVIVDNDPDNDEYVVQLAALKSGRIKYYRNRENIGLFQNWNRCIELATADEIVFLHSDDLLLPDALKTLWGLHIRVEPEACILAQSVFTDMQNNLLSPYKALKPKIFGLLKPKEYFKFDAYSIFKNDHDTGCGALYNRNILMKIGGYQCDLYPSGDALIHISYYKYAPVYRLLKQTRHTRVGENASAKNAIKYAQCNYYIRKRIIEEFFNNNRILHYVHCLGANTIDDNLYRVKSVKKNGLLRRCLFKLECLFYTFHTSYRIF